MSNPTTALRAFHGDPEIKKRYLERIAEHEAADEIVHGLYWENGKGCAVGCTIHSGDHGAYETELGLPRWLARLEDGMFERQENGASKTFPRRFLEAIPPGADCEAAKLPFLAWLMDDSTYGLAFTAREQEIKDLATEVGAKLRAGLTTGPDAEALSKKLWAAWDARTAWDAWDARAAWDAWAAWAARDPWDAWAARAARDARDPRDPRDPWDAWDAWPARAARPAFVTASVAELLRLLAALPGGVR